MNEAVGRGDDDEGSESEEDSVDGSEALEEAERLAAVDLVDHLKMVKAAMRCVAALSAHPTVRSLVVDVVLPEVKGHVHLSHNQCAL